MMLAIAVFILHTSPPLVSVPSLQYPCINHFRQCFQNDQLVVKLKCVQTMRSIFVNAPLKTATPYIHALAPRVIESMCMPTAKNPKNETELAIVFESIGTVEALIQLAEPQNRKYQVLIFWQHSNLERCLFS